MGKSGFSLIELSIVLIIIGFMVGGILTGQNLMNAAAISAQISQITRYNTAVINFQTKYDGYLPGDIPNPVASKFGFVSRGNYAGEGDGNGVLEGVYSDTAGNNNGSDQVTGENGMLWVDLSTANLIDGGFHTATPNVYNGGTSIITAYLPRARIENNNYIYSYSHGGLNYWAISTMTWLGSGIPSTTAAMSVMQAYIIDTKVDDGFPQSGNVTAQYLDGVSFGWAVGLGWAGSGGITGAPYTTATAGSSTSCYDNGNTNGATQQYSIKQNSGNGVNCALSFQFQAQ